METDNRITTFVDQVRSSYLQVYGNDELGDEPFTIGTVVVAFVVNHLNGDQSEVFLFDGSRMEALGLCRLGVDNYISP